MSSQPPLPSCLLCLPCTPREALGDPGLGQPLVSVSRGTDRETEVQRGAMGETAHMEAPHQEAGMGGRAQSWACGAESRSLSFTYRLQRVGSPGLAVPPWGWERADLKPWLLGQLRRSERGQERGRRASPLVGVTLLPLMFCLLPSLLRQVHNTQCLGVFFCCDCVCYCSGVRARVVQADAQQVDGPARGWRCGWRAGEANMWMEIDERWVRRYVDG